MKEESSTIFGSTRISLVCSGVRVKRRDMIMLFRQTDFPDPVEPATRRWGILARSSIRCFPAASFPRHKGSAWFEALKFLEERRSLRRTSSPMGFGTSTPNVDLPGIGATILMLWALTDIAMSSSSALIFSTFIPGASSISNMVMTGPFWISTTSASILKDLSVCSSLDEITEILFFSSVCDTTSGLSRRSSGGIL